MTAPSLRIRRWRSDFLIPHDCIAPERIRADLDDIAEGLRDELVMGLAPWFSTQAGEVVLVKSLVFDCELDLNREPELLAPRWAHQFAKALINAVESGGDGVLRFSSSAAYRAQFIADLASGHGGFAWYYRSFAGLAALPPTGAIRTVLLEDSALGREILAALSPEVWNRLGTVLTRREALRILEELSAGESPDMAEPAALAALYREHAPHLPAAPWFVTALYLFAAALRAGLSPTPDLARWVRLAAKLPALATRTDAPALVEALQEGNMGVLVAADTERDAESWAALSVRSQWRSTLAEILRAEAARASDTAIPTRGEAARTVFGGLVLLLPELDETLSDALPPAEQASARGLAAWLVLAQCAGQGRATQFVGEAFWRDMFGVPPEIDRARLNRWLADVDATPAAARLAERAAALTRGGCFSTPLRTGGQRWLISVDQTSGLWCGMCPDFDSPHPNPLPEGEGDFNDLFPEGKSVVGRISASASAKSGAGIPSSFPSTATVVGWAKADRPCPSFSELRWARCALPILRPGFHPNPPPLGEGRVRGARKGSTQSPDSFASTSWRARLAAARRARDDWRYLAMDWGLPEPWQRLFTHMAQIVLRRFAYRIPGFAGASLPYVYTNFLTGPGTLDPVSGRLQLARPPLHVLLNLTGIGRGTVRWSGPPERSFLLDYES